MKHGNKAQTKTAKSVKDSTGRKKSDTKAAGPRGKGGKAESKAPAGKENGKNSSKGASKGASKIGAKQAESKAGSKAAAPETPRPVAAAAKIAPGRDKAPANGFTNPVVANAFKRAVKKYPVAFKRLSDQT